MNNRIAINMIKSYSCLTQTPNNIYLGSTLIPKYRECAMMIISILKPLPTYIVTSFLTSLYLFCISCFKLLIFSNRTSIKYTGDTINTSKVHINNLYIKYTLVHFAILLIHQIFSEFPLPVTTSFVVEALSFRLWSSFELLHGSDNLLAILLEVYLSFPLPFTWN